MEPRVIAELGTCAGSVQWAHDAIEAVAATGVWAVKTQILSADTLAAMDSPRYDRLAGPRTQHEAFREQIPRDAWGEIKAHANEVGLEWFASVWDWDAIDLCEKLEVEYYKIGSADITYLDFINDIAATGQTIILSTGAANLAEIEDAIEAAGNTDIIVMACTLSYPADAKDAFLGKMVLMRSDPILESRVDAWGYSDHTQLTDIAGLAVAAGCQYLEKHFTITPGAGGDHDFALDPFQMASYVEYANRAHRLMWPTPVAQVLPSELPARELARRSLHAIEDINPGGSIIPGYNAEFLRPTGGIEPNESWSGPLVAQKAIPAGSPIRWSDLARDHKSR